MVDLAVETSPQEPVSAPSEDQASATRLEATSEQTSSDSADGARRDPIMDSKIMIVDDEPANIMIARKYLRDAGYTDFVCTSDPTEALDTIKQQDPAILLLDVMMPQVSGIDILRVLRLVRDTEHLPVLILTASTDSETKRDALHLGATDFLAKPVDPSDLIPRVHNALLVKAYQDRLANHVDHLEQEVRKRTAELEVSRQEIVHALARVAEYRDDCTGRHVVRVGRYAGVIARALDFREARVRLLEMAAQMHDVGKIAIPDAIVNSPGKLTPEEFSIIQTHCAVAKTILGPIPEREWQELKTHSERGADLLQIRSSPLLMLAAKIARTHHERWDGTGYPMGLAGEDIPIEGRITAVADVFDALSTPRSYKPPFPREKCFAILEEGRGTHFDPKVLDAFFTQSEEIVRIQLECMDPA